MNRRRHANTLPLLSLATWIVVGAFVCIAGLGYVYCKNQLHSSGTAIKKLERELIELRTSCEVAQTKIASLSSRAELKRKLDTGFIKLQPIGDAHLVRINHIHSPTQAGADSELRPVANSRLTP